MEFMKSWIGPLAAHPTAANLLMILFLLLGFMNMGDIRRETFPDFASTKVSVTVVYPGATAEDVESAVCQRIEEAVEGISNLIKVTSKASEGRATVTLEMRDGADSTEFLNDIKTEVDAISNFPEEVEDVIVKRLNRTDQVLSIAVTGPMSEPHLKLYCEQLKEKIKQLPLVSQVEILGFSEHQLQVEIPLYNLMRLGLSVSDIQSVLQNQSIDMPAGTIETDHSYVFEGKELLRSRWRFLFLADGQLRIGVTVTAVEALPPMPRIGAQLQLSEAVSCALTDVEWFGRGPHENYPDRQHSADYGRWRTDLSAMHTDYIFPSDNGLRCDVTELSLGEVRIAGHFHFSVSPYGQARLAAANHSSDLEAAEGVYVYIDGFHMGVGGDDSWTPSCKERYRLTDNRYNWAFSLS